MIDPYERNSDEDRQGIAADGYHIGESEGEIVIAFSVASLPCDIGVFLDKDEAFEFLGRFTQELKAKGWLA